MSIFKIVAISICAIFLILSVSGNDFIDNSFSNGINTAAAMKIFPPDKVMLSTGDLEVNWGLFYFYLHNTASQVTNYFQTPADWTEAFSPGETLADAVKAYSIDQAVQFLVYSHGFTLYNVTLSDSEREILDSMFAEMIEEAGSLEALETDLQFDGFFNLSVYEQWIINYILQDKLPSVMYGASYTEFPDNFVADFALRNGYMQASHILIGIPSEYDGYSAQEIEDAKSAALEEAEEILNILNPNKNNPDFISFFRNLALERSDDPGVFSFPDGYLFQYYDMVESFSAACEDLTVGEMSGIVESVHGYHIILRLPLDFDNAVPVAISGSGQSYSLRQLAIFEDFENNLLSWYDSLPIDYAPELDSLDVAHLFAWHD